MRMAGGGPYMYFFINIRNNYNTGGRKPNGREKTEKKTIFL